MRSAECSGQCSRGLLTLETDAGRTTRTILCWQSLVSKLAARFAAGSDELAQLVRKNQDLSAEADRLDKNIITTVSKPPAERNPSAEDQIRKRSDDIKSEDCGRRGGCAYARSYPADAYSSTCPIARLGSGACTGFLGAERDCGGRGGCAYARSYPADAYSSTCPAACLGSGASTGFLGAEGDSHDHGCPRWAGGNGYTLAACARSTQLDTGRSKAERRSGVCGRKSGCRAVTVVSFSYAGR